MNLNPCLSAIISQSFAESCNGPKPGKTKPNVSQLDRQALAWAIYEAINQLPEPQRDIFIMHHYDGMPIPAIAAVKNLSVEQIRELLDEGSKKLFSQLRIFRKAKA